MVGGGLLFILWGLSAALLILAALLAGITWTSILIKVLVIVGGFFLVSGLVLSIIGTFKLRKIRRSRRGN